jgi:3-methylcrotonyl-CoA carboxylase alpha subunit
MPRTSTDRHSPWQRRDFWRLGGEVTSHFRFRDAEGERAVALRFAEGRYVCEIDGQSSVATAQQNTRGDLVIALDGARLDAVILKSSAEIWVVLPQVTSRLVYIDPLAPAHRAADTAGKILAPMPGKVSAVLVAPGATVRRGQTLVLVEAMKMELAIIAPEEGVVAAVNVAIGALIEEGTELVVLRAS